MNSVYITAHSVKIRPPSAIAVVGEFNVDMATVRRENTRAMYRMDVSCENRGRNEFW